MFSHATKSQTENFSSLKESPPTLQPQMWPESMIGQRESPVRVFVVDDDCHIRRVIAQDLMRDPRTLFIGESPSLRDAKKHICQKHFDILLLDLNLGDGDGIDLLDFVNENLPNVLTIIISITEREDRLFQAFSHGAQGFLLKKLLVWGLCTGCSSSGQRRCIHYSILSKKNSLKNQIR